MTFELEITFGELVRQSADSVPHFAAPTTSCDQLNSGGFIRNDISFVF